jgi:hypothetical protein
MGMSKFPTPSPTQASGLILRPKAAAESIYAALAFFPDPGNSGGLVLEEVSLLIS